MGTNCGKHLCKGQHDCGSCNETKQGKWLNRKEIFDGDTQEVDAIGCSVCGKSQRKYSKTPYCPNCGAKMDLEAENV